MESAFFIQVLLMTFTCVGLMAAIAMLDYIPFFYRRILFKIGALQAPHQVGEFVMTQLSHKPMKIQAIDIKWPLYNKFIYYYEIDGQVCSETCTNVRSLTNEECYEAVFDDILLTRRIEVHSCFSLQ